MGFLARTSTVVSPARIRAQDVLGGDPFAGFYGSYVPPAWSQQFRDAGIPITPDLALTLSAMYRGVTMIAGDIATMPCQIWRILFAQDGTETGRVRSRNHPIAYTLRWQPNSIQTAKEFWMMLIGHFLLRGNAYAEIIAGPRGFADELRPIHPDRVTPERVNGDAWRLRYRLDELGKPSRYLTQDEVFVFRDFSGDPFRGMSRIAYALRSLSTAITQERFTNAFFRKGATGGLVATVKGGELDEEDAKALHGNITRYLAGAENAGGVLVIEDDLDIKNISLDLDKAQLMELATKGVHDVERWLGLPPGRLGAQDQTHADAAVVQSNLQYGTSTLRPILIGIEQAIQRDLILAPDTYQAEFNMDALLRADLKTRYESYQLGITSRVIWPSEARVKEGLNPDPRLDELAATDRRPGTPKGTKSGGADQQQARADGGLSRSDVRATLLAYDAAQRVIRKEVAAVTKLAEKHASDVGAWHAAIDGFYQDHATFVGQTMRLQTPVARAYAAQHLDLLKSDGVNACASWERLEAEELAALALDIEGVTA